MLSQNVFIFLNKKETISLETDWNNKKFPKLWLYNLHYFDDLISFNYKSRKKWHYALLDDWIINNKLFGHHVKNYREGKGIPKKSKPVILGTLWVFVLFAVLIAIPDSAPPVSKITVLVLAVIGTIVIVRIPNLKQ